jgi:hypothetical protein
MSTPSAGISGVFGGSVEREEPERQPLALIVGAARSGTTLLRLTLDAHPEIGCPAEAGVPGLMAHMAQLWMTVDADITAPATSPDPGAAGPEKRVDAAGGASVAEDETPGDPLEGLPPAARGKALSSMMRNSLWFPCLANSEAVRTRTSLNSSGVQIPTS